MPSDSTPRMTPLPSVIFLPGIYVPGAEKTLFSPVRALGAPQTTCTGAPRPYRPCRRADDRRSDAASPRSHPRDGEVFQLRGGVVHMFDLEADARERLDDLGERGGRVEMLFEPGEGEFHGRFLK